MILDNLPLLFLVLLCTVALTTVAFPSEGVRQEVGAISSPARPVDEILRPPTHLLGERLLMRQEGRDRFLVSRRLAGGVQHLRIDGELGVHDVPAPRGSVYQAWV